MCEQSVLYQRLVLGLLAVLAALLLTLLGNDAVPLAVHDSDVCHGTILSDLCRKTSFSRSEMQLCLLQEWFRICSDCVRKTYVQRWDDFVPQRGRGLS